jgi:hypothetical protein
MNPYSFPLTKAPMDNNPHWLIQKRPKKEGEPQKPRRKHFNKYAKFSKKHE